MTQASLISTTLGFLLGCVGLLILCALYRDYRNDALRDRLFALRDEMFRDACDQGLLSSRPYQDLRRLINGMIRYAHQVSFSRLILLAMAWQLSGMRKKRVRAYDEWRAAVKELPKEQRDALKSFHFRAQVLFAEHIAYGCPVFWPLLGYHFARNIILRAKKPNGGGPTAPIYKRMPSVKIMEADAFRSAA